MRTLTAPMLAYCSSSSTTEALSTSSQDSGRSVPKDLSMLPEMSSSSTTLLSIAEAALIVFRSYVGDRRVVVDGDRQRARCGFIRVVAHRVREIYDRIVLCATGRMKNRLEQCEDVVAHSVVVATVNLHRERSRRVRVELAVSVLLAAFQEVSSPFRCRPFQTCRALTRSRTGSVAAAGSLPKLCGQIRRSRSWPGQRRQRVRRRCRQKALRRRRLR